MRRGGSFIYDDDDSKSNNSLSDMGDYELTKVIEPAKDDKHAVNLYKSLLGHVEKFYFGKTFSSVLVAREVAIQNGLRAFIPYSPEGRVVTDGGEYSAFSEAVPGFRSLRDLIDTKGIQKVIDNINSGKYSGFGDVLVQIMLSGEYDMHNRNIGIDDKGRFVKIDADWSCGRLRLKEDPSALKGQFRITPEGIALLPFLHLPDRLVYNWFDQIGNGKVKPLNKQILLSSIDDSVLRPEINRAMLKVMLMPAEYMHEIIMQQSIDKSESETTYFEWMNSRLQMFTSVCADPRFIEYMKTAEARKVLEDFKIELNQYQTNSGSKFDTEDDINESLNERFDQLDKLTKTTRYTPEWNVLSMPFIDLESSNKYGETPLSMAIDYGDKNIFSLLLKKGADINYHNAKGESPLTLAAAQGKDDIVAVILTEERLNINLAKLDAVVYGHIGILKELLSRDANLNLVTTRQETLLLVAAKNGQMSTVKFLLDSGLNPETPDDKNRSPLLHAIFGGHTDTAKYLLEITSPSEKDLNNALLLASQLTDITLIEELLNRGADISHRSSSGRTPLVFASERGNTDVVKYLITVRDQMGGWPADTLSISNPEDAIKERQNALQQAVQHNKAETVAYLLDHVNISSKQLNQLLIIAAQLGYMETVRSLVMKGADVNAIDPERKYSVLMWAARNGRAGVIRYLITDEKLNINLQTKDGVTALLKAAEYKHWDCFDAIINSDKISTASISGVKGGANVIDFLIEEGKMSLCARLLAKVNMSVPEIDKKYNVSLLHAAIEKNDHAAIQALLDLGASVATHNPEKKGQTPLMYAAEVGSVGSINALLNVNKIKDAELNLALHVAVQNNQLDAVNYLLMSGANINFKDSNGDTPFMKAIANEYWDIVKALYRVPDLEFNHVNNDNESAFSLLLTAGNAELCEQMLLDLDRPDEIVERNLGYTLLHIAITQQDVDAVDRLLQAGASIHVASTDGHTPLMMATIIDNNEINEMILHAISTKDKAKEPVKLSSSTAMLSKSMPRDHSKQNGVLMANSPEDTVSAPARLTKNSEHKDSDSPAAKADSDQDDDLRNSGHSLK